MSSEFEDFVRAWLNPGSGTNSGDGQAPLADVRGQQDAVDDRVDDVVIAAELAAIRERAERRSELAHADMLFSKGDVEGARELWQRVASSGHPEYSPRARARLTSPTPGDSDSDRDSGTVPPKRSQDHERAVFISFRSGDEPDAAEHIREQLDRYFAGHVLGSPSERQATDAYWHPLVGEHQRSLRRGTMLRALDRSVLVFVIIGRHWLDPDPATGRARLNDPADWVREEISQALRRGLRVVPVLVHGASLPTRDELPPDLAPLAALQTVRFSGHYLELDRLTEITAEFLRRSRRPRTRRRKRKGGEVQKRPNPLDPLRPGSVPGIGAAGDIHVVGQDQDGRT